MKTSHIPPGQLISVNEPVKGWVSLNLKELWYYRDLLFYLLLRDVKVRYKQTIVGLAWVIMQPLATVVVFTFVFGRMAQLPSDGLPYPIFSFAGLLPWNLFTSSISGSTNSLIASGSMMKKVYFPRLILPISKALIGLVDFAITFIALIAVMVYYGVLPTVNIIWLPLFIILTFISSLGMGVWLSALNVQFRDVTHLVPFIIRLGLFLTPVLYPTSLVSQPLQIIYSLNPMVGVVEGFRWALLGTTTLSFQPLLTSSLVALVIFVSGLYYFRRMEASFADVI